MFHKNAANSSSSLGPTLVSSTNLHGTRTSPAPKPNANQQQSRVDADFIRVASRRCSSFFAEAAVLVLVFGNLDYFMLKGRLELPWIAAILLVSLTLLAGSIFTEARAQRWIDAHP
jgi:cell division protein FtsW (lipid II flippase)